MSRLAEPQLPIPRTASFEIAPFQLRAESARQISPRETWYRIAPAPCMKRNGVRVVRSDDARSVRIPGAPNLVITGGISEQNR